MLDLEVGTCAVGEDPIAEELLATLLRMQGEGGYSSADGSSRVAELLAWARTLADGGCALEAVGSNLSPALAEEMLTNGSGRFACPTTPPALESSDSGASSRCGR